MDVDENGGGSVEMCTCSRMHGDLESDNVEEDWGPERKGHGPGGWNRA